jgi:hypothetical protein
MADTLVFEKAHVLCYRLFDIAEEIDLEKARALLSADSRRLKLTREGSEMLLLPNPPLNVELARKSLPLNHGSATVDVTARIFDHGAISIILRVPVKPGATLAEMVPYCDELYDSVAVEHLAVEMMQGLRGSLTSAMRDGHLWSQNESYTIIFVEKIEGSPTAAQILENDDMPRLLLGESHEKKLSKRERHDVLEHQFSYTDNDLVIVDWNSAFVYEPSGSYDIPDLLEIVNAQLLELRYYDDVLDKQLDLTYAEISHKRRRWYGLLYSPYRGLARRVLVTLLELSEFVERVENTLKIVGDFYLAKVYEAAVMQLRIRKWQESVTRKQGLLAQTYELLKGEVEVDRSMTLEVVIVLLIVSEIFIAVFSAVK